MYQHKKKTGSFFSLLLQHQWDWDNLFNIFAGRLCCRCCCCFCCWTQNWTKNNIFFCVASVSIDFVLFLSHFVPLISIFLIIALYAYAYRQTNVRWTECERKEERKRKTSKEKLKIQMNFSFQFIFVNDFWHFNLVFSWAIHSKYITTYNVIAIYWIVLNRRHMSIEQSEHTKKEKRTQPDFEIRTL